MTVNGVTKVLPGDRVIFKDVSASFLDGAKIGIVGPNGAGKSTLLKMLAGADREFDGDVWRKDGLRIGHLAQEPELDPTKDVHGNIMEGLRFKTDLLDRFNAISEAMADPDADFDKVRRPSRPAAPAIAERPSRLPRACCRPAHPGRAPGRRGRAPARPRRGATSPARPRPRPCLALPPRS